MVIRTWHICISGFTQRMGSMTGTMKMWQKIRFVASPTVEVMPITWKANVWELAEHIWLTGGTWDTMSVPMPEIGVTAKVKEYQPFPRIYVYAYSWGAGWCFLRLAKELRRRGLAVERALLCDPVYRSPLLPSSIPFNPSSWFGKWPIYVPDNVKRVSWFYQTEKKPWAHNVKAMDPECTIIDEPIRLHGVEHVYMDDHPRYHEAASDIARESMA